MADRRHRDTMAVAAGRPSHVSGGPVNVPISVSSTYHHFSQRNYIREGSDSVAAFEAALGALDLGTAVAFSSGMAAISALAESLPVGSRVVIPAQLYSGAGLLWAEQRRLGKAEVVEVDLTNTEATIAALGSHTDLLWAFTTGSIWDPFASRCWQVVVFPSLFSSISTSCKIPAWPMESPSNPLMEVADLPSLCKAGHRVGATVVVDSTFTTPILQRPLQLGADIVMHSATKYLGGHSDLLMGALVAADAAVAEKLRARRSISGGVPGALEAFLALRGIRTLPVRMQQHQCNAAIIAQRLDANPTVDRVLYPGLPSFPGHLRAAAQQEGFGAMLSFTVQGGKAAAEELCASLQLIAHATSLGGVESAIERRAQYSTDASKGTPSNLLRLSVGLEHVEDIWIDLAQALDASQRQVASKAL